MKDNELLEIAKNAAEYSYSPYSKFRVGAALLTKSGKIYTGCNIENASYGATVCAERTAVFKALSEGEKEFDAIAVYSPDSENCSPCGICRQVLSEFSIDMYVIYRTGENKAVKKKLPELIPDVFK